MASALDRLSEFQKLCDARDLAAARVLGAVDLACCYFEAHNYEQTYDILKRARDSYRAAAAKVNEFHESQSQGEKRHGNRPAA